MSAEPDTLGLANRLLEASCWLEDDIPAGTREIQFLEGDVKLDELDLYCVNLMREAATALGRRDAAGAGSIIHQPIGGGPTRYLKGRWPNPASPPRDQG